MPRPASLIATAPAALSAVLCVALCIVLSAVLLVFAPQTGAQSAVQLFDPAEAEAALSRATRESRRAEARAAQLTLAAEAATEAAVRTASQAAALAAQIQQAEAEIEVARARLSIARAQRSALTARLAEKQAPTARLVAALQTAARRPLVLSALQPGSLKDVVHMRAVIDSAVPQIRARTAALRSELDRGRALEAQATRAIDQLRSGEVTLRSRRQSLAMRETQQRVASRSARGAALREGERALALAEQARDLDGLVDRLDGVAALRRELAALPGPVLRPADLAAGPPFSARPTAASPTAALPTTERTEPALAPAAAAASTTTVARTAPPPADFQLPVQGRTLVGFGAKRDSGQASTGLTLAPVAGAQVVAPGRGRIAFAGAYRGFGRIIIIEHAGGWITLVTGLGRVDVAVGDTVIGGSPVGVTGAASQPVTLELRRAGTPVNPLQFLR